MLDRDSYVDAVYAKTALALRTLDGVARRTGQGDATRCGDYCAPLWRFAHPSERDFRTAFSADHRAAPDLAALFSQLLRRHRHARLRRRARRRARGAAAAPGAGDGGMRAAAEAPRYRSEVVVERRGEVRMPVDIVVVFDDGGETRETWDGHGRWYRIDITSTRQATYAVVDPDDKLPLDANRLNNSRMREPGTRGLWRLGGRWGLWLQGALLMLSGL